MAVPPEDPAVAYARQLFAAPRDARLMELERDAAERGIPILGPAAAGFVAALARLAGGQRLLELGTATGYTSTWLGRVARELGGQLVTVERDPKMAAEARGNLAKAGLDGVARVAEGDALAFLQERGEVFDLILLDIEKGEYASALPAAVERLRVGGVLVADNCSFPEARPYTSLALSEPRLDTVLVHGFWPGHSPEWDALCLSVRRAQPMGVQVGTLG